MLAALLVRLLALATAVAAAPVNVGAATGVQIVDCASAAAGPWALDPKTSALSLTDGATRLCAEPDGPLAAHGQLVLVPCPAHPTPWGATDAPGFPALAIKSQPGQWGPAALLGKVAIGHPAMLYSLLSVKGYCASHHSCDFVLNETTKKIVNPETQLCLGSGQRRPPPPGPPAPPRPHPPRPVPPPPNLAYTCEVGQPLAGTPTCDRALGFKARAEDLASKLNISDHIDLFFS